MKTALRIVLLFFAFFSLGCATKYGVALVNRSPSDLSNVQLTSKYVWVGAWKQTINAGVIPSNGFFYIDPILLYPSQMTATWSVGPNQLQHDVYVSVPDDFDQVLAFEFDGSTVRQVRVKRVDLNNFLHKPQD
jgi:hypothetical protein